MPTEVAQEFADSLRPAGLLVSTEVRPNIPQASIEWLIPTAVTLFVANKYFGTLLHEAAKDHYQVFKNALARLIKRTTGKNREVVIKTFGSGGKVIDPNPIVLSVYAELTEGRKAKFCFEHTLEHADAHLVSDGLLEALIRYHQQADDSRLLSEEKLVAPRDWKPILMRYDVERGEWFVWHFKPPILELD